MDFWPHKIIKKFNILPQPEGGVEYAWDEEAHKWWKKLSWSKQCKLMQKYFPTDYYVKVTKADGTCTMECRRQESHRRDQVVDIWEVETGNKSVETIKIEHQWELAKMREDFIKQKQLEYKKQNESKSSKSSKTIKSGNIS